MFRNVAHLIFSCSSSFSTSSFNPSFLIFIFYCFKVNTGSDLVVPDSEKGSTGLSPRWLTKLVVSFDTLFNNSLILPPLFCVDRALSMATRSTEVTLICCVGFISILSISDWTRPHSSLGNWSLLLVKNDKFVLVLLFGFYVPVISFQNYFAETFLWLS